VSKPPYEILEHTADIGLKVHGRSLPELFVNAAKGLAALASSQEGLPVAEGGVPLPLRAQGADLEEAMVAWLSEILYFMDADGWVFSEFRVDRVVEHPGESAVEGKGLGERRDPQTRSRAIPVKAVTYHQISVREAGGGWEAVVYFDI
jgi:protein archease